MKTQTEIVDVTERTTGRKVGFHEIASFTHEGKTFTSGGAHIDPEKATAYVSSDGLFLTTWNGKILALLHVTAKWATPRSFVSPEMWQAEATINGVQYTGRTAGPGMVWKGRRKKGCQ